MNKDGRGGSRSSAMISPVHLAAVYQCNEAAFHPFSLQQLFGDINGSMCVS